MSRLDETYLGKLYQDANAYEEFVYGPVILVDLFIYNILISIYILINS